LTDNYDPPGDTNRPSDPWDGFEPLDPFSELKDLSEAEPLPPLEDPTVPPATPPRSPILTGIIVALLLIVLTVAFFQFLRQDDDDTVAGGTTIPETTVTPTTGGTSDTTTAPDETNGTDAGTDTATTQPATGVFEPYEASGEPVALSELTLAVDGVGPIEFGTPARQSVGRLIASLGDPDEDTGPVVSTGAYGTCAGETERIVRWGPFVAIVVVDPDGSETFAAYRLDLNYGDDLSADAVNLETLSGLKAGFSVLQLEQVYSAFDLQYEVVDDIGQTYQLFSSNTGNLLLWGPVTSDESTGIVLGIYSPDACGRF
jgi:hypothetical protein